jgi:hypothetical protein
MTCARPDSPSSLRHGIRDLTRRQGTARRVRHVHLQDHPEGGSRHRALARGHGNRPEGLPAEDGAPPFLAPSARRRAPSERPEHFSVPSKPMARSPAPGASRARALSRPVPSEPLCDRSGKCHQPSRSTRARSRRTRWPRQSRRWPTTRRCCWSVMPARSSGTIASGCIPSRSSTRQLSQRVCRLSHALPRVRM